MTAVRVYVNAVPLDVPAGASALECVKAWRVEEARAVEQGTRVITDSRGLPVAADAPASAGSIYRTVANRADARGE